MKTKTSWVYLWKKRLFWKSRTFDRKTMKPLRITSIRSNFPQELGTKRNTYRKLISIAKTYAAYILKIFKRFKRDIMWRTSSLKCRIFLAYLMHPGSSWEHHSRHNNVKQYSGLIEIKNNLKKKTLKNESRYQFYWKLF